MRGGAITTAGRSINIIDLAAKRLPPAYIARACGCTEAHVRDVMSRFGGGAHEVMTVIVPAGVARALEARAVRAGCPLEQVISDILADRAGCDMDEGNA